MTPVILRGVTLYGINCVFANNVIRHKAWDLLAQNVDNAKFGELTVEIGLSQVIDCAQGVLAAKVRGRTVVDVNR